jgi:hypothetical protein
MKNSLEKLMPKEKECLCHRTLGCYCGYRNYNQALKDTLASLKGKVVVVGEIKVEEINELLDDTIYSFCGQACAVCNDNDICPISYGEERDRITQAILTYLKGLAEEK